MITRRLSVGSRRTSKGTLGLKDSAPLSDAGSMARVKSRVRYADGSTPPSPLDGLEPQGARGPSGPNDQGARRAYMVPAVSPYAGHTITPHNAAEGGRD